MGISNVASAPLAPITTQVAGPTAPKGPASSAPPKPVAPTTAAGTDNDGDHDGSGVGGKVDVRA
jgi:hypothetical protein